MCPIPSNPSCHPHSHTLENTCVRSIPGLHWHCEELGIARVNPTGEATAGSSHPQPCGALGEEQSDPEEHKILSAARLHSELAYKEMNRGPLQGGSCLSAVKGIRVRGSIPSLSTVGPIPGAPAEELSWGCGAGAGVQHQREGESSARTQSPTPPGTARAQTGSPAPRGTNGARRGGSGC